MKELADDGVGLNDAADVIAAKYSWISSRVEIMASPVSPRAKCLCRLKYLATFPYDSSGLEYANNHSLGQLALRYDYTTLNAVNYPTSGLAIHAAAMGLLGRTWINATPGHHVKWLQISGNVAKYFNLHKHFALGLTGEGWRMYALTNASSPVTKSGDPVRKNSCSS